MIEGVQTLKDLNTSLVKELEREKESNKSKIKELKDDLEYAQEEKNTIMEMVTTA